MSNGNRALAVREDIAPARVDPARAVPALMPSEQDFATMAQLAEAVVKSDLAPPAVKTPQAALVIIEKGRELGIPPMHALSAISVIEGKPAVGAELMLALIRRDYGSRAIRVAATSDEACTVEYRQDGWPGVQAYTFTFEQAKKAGLTGKQNWQKYPAAMLRARCVSAVARLAFPDSIGGLYTPEELGGDAGGYDGDGGVPISRVRMLPVDAPESAVSESASGELVDTETGELFPPPPREARADELVTAVMADAPSDEIVAGSEEERLIFANDVLESAAVDGTDAVGKGFRVLAAEEWSEDGRKQLYGLYQAANRSARKSRG